MQLSGTIKQAFPMKQRGKWKITDFVLKNEEGEFKCSKFGTFPADLLGCEVSFDAKESEYNGKMQYTVNGEFDGQGAAPKAKKAEAAAPAPKVDREEYRAKAEEAVAKNIQSAMKLKTELGLETVDLIQLSDMVGRTLTALSLDGKRGY